MDQYGRVITADTLAYLPEEKAFASVGVAWRGRFSNSGRVSLGFPVGARRAPVPDRGVSLEDVFGSGAAWSSVA